MCHGLGTDLLDRLPRTTRPRRASVENVSLRWAIGLRFWELTVSREPVVRNWLDVKEVMRGGGRGLELDILGLDFSSSRRGITALVLGSIIHRYGVGDSYPFWDCQPLSLIKHSARSRHRGNKCRDGQGMGSPTSAENTGMPPCKVHSTGSRPRSCQSSGHRVPPLSTAVGCVGGLVAGSGSGLRIPRRKLEAELTPLFRYDTEQDSEEACAWLGTWCGNKY